MQGKGEEWDRSYMTHSSTGMPAELIWMPPSGSITLTGNVGGGGGGGRDGGEEWVRSYRTHSSKELPAGGCYLAV